MKKWWIALGIVILVALSSYCFSKITTSATTITGDGDINIISGSGFLKISPTWNNGATTFTGLQENVTDTASAAVSLLMDLQVASTSKFSVDKTGLMTLVKVPISTAPAATNFTRVELNRGIRSGGTPSATSIATTCTAINLNSVYGVPTTAKMVLLRVTGSMSSGTALGGEAISIPIYSDSGCTALIAGDTMRQTASWNIYSATTSAGVILLQANENVWVYVNGASTIYAKMQQTLVTGGSTAVQISDVPEYIE